MTAGDGQYGVAGRILMFGLCDALDIAPSELLKDVERRMRLQAKASLSSVD